MPAPTITALPTAPSRSDPGNFNSVAESFVDSLATMQSEVNSFGTYLNSNSTIVGGELNSTSIGATTPSSGAFTSLSASSDTAFSGAAVFSSTLYVVSVSFDSGANVLSQYEEGTFTPVLSDGTNNATTYSIQLGTYTLVGNLVTAQIRISVSNLGSVSGALRVTGLPFAARSSPNVSGTVQCGYASSLNITAGQSVTGYIGASSTSANLRLWDATTGNTPMTEAEFSVGGDLMLTVIYTSA